MGGFKTKRGKKQAKGKTMSAWDCLQDKPIERRAMIRRKLDRRVMSVRGGAGGVGVSWGGGVGAGGGSGLAPGGGWKGCREGWGTLSE